MPDAREPVAGAEVIPPGEFSALLAEIARAGPRSGGGWERWLRPGAVVGRFELVRELGQGGFGVVWEARDVQLGRRVAFKAVRPGERVGAREERLIREAEAAARLSHPNVVTLHDAGTCEHGPYLVLELLRGQPLSRRLEQGAMPVREALRVVVEVARAVAHAHGEGIVHRDLKPANVFLCEDGRVKVLDFGLAHAFGRPRAEGGTPAYMAPEQARGAPEDERTDVFALGAMLYRMLAGALPFPRGGGRAFASSKPAPRLEVPDVPALGDLVARMLETDPVRRPRDGGEVLAALLAFQSELERSASTGAGPVRRPRPGRRALLLALTGAGVVVAGLLLVFGVNRPPPGAVPAAPPGGRRVVVVSDVENATGEGDLDGLARVLVLSVEQSRSLNVLSRSRIQGLSRTSGQAPLPRIDDATAREAARNASARALLLLAVHRVGGTYVLELRAEDPGSGDTLFAARETAATKDAIVPALDRLSDRTRREFGEHPADVEATRIQLARLQGSSLEAYDLWLRSVDVVSQYGEVGQSHRLLLRAAAVDPDFAPVRFDLSVDARNAGDSSGAASHLAAARASIHRLPERERLLYELEFAVEDGARPAELDRRARAIVDQFPNDKVLLQKAAQIQWRWIGDRKAAEALYRRGLAIDPGLMCLAGDLVNLLGEQGRTGEAVQVARRAVADRPSAPNKTILAVALAADGAIAEAVDWARDAIRVAGGGSRYVTELGAEILARGGALDEAEAEYRRVLATSEFEGDRRQAAFGLVSLLALQGRRAAALETAARVPISDRIRSQPEPAAFLAGVGHPRLRSPAALAALRALPPGPETAAMLAFHGDLAAASGTVDSGSRAGRYLGALRDASEGRVDEAVATFRALGADATELRKHQFLYLAGESLLAAGRPAEAVEALRPATGMAMPLFGPLDVAANFPRAVLVRARALEQLGNAPEALAELDRLAALWARADPELPLLAEARALQARLAVAP